MTPAEQLARKLRASQDTADLARQNAELRERIEELERERDAAEGFAALAAHELMSPLVFTEACVAIASERLEPSDDLLEALEALGRGASRTRKLIEALLHDARSGGHAFRGEPVDLNALAHDAVQLLRPEIDARSASVALEPLPEVVGEPEGLGGVFTNLLMNALKFNPRQGGAIRMGAESGDAEWTIFVESEGPPIPESDRERIFEPYHRGRGERRARGVGLGLTICRRIVERHGGRIGVLPTPDGAGNRFQFTLPI